MPQNKCGNAVIEGITRLQQRVADKKHEYEGIDVDATVLQSVREQPKCRQAMKGLHCFPHYDQAAHLHLFPLAQGMRYYFTVAKDRKERCKTDDGCCNRYPDSDREHGLI